MSAAVLPFTGTCANRFERSPTTQRLEAQAIRDARLIKEAKSESDTWVGAAFLALLQVLDVEQRQQMEAVLANRGTHEAEQALAIVRYRNGTREHCGRVAVMVDRLLGEGGQ